MAQVASPMHVRARDAPPRRNRPRRGSVASASHNADNRSRNSWLSWGAMIGFFRASDSKIDSPSGSLSAGSQHRKRTRSLRSFACGHRKRTRSLRSFARGHRKRTRSLRSFARGHRKRTRSLRSFALGHRKRTRSLRSFALGHRKRTRSLLTSYGPSRLFSDATVSRLTSSRDSDPGCAFSIALASRSHMPAWSRSPSAA